LIVFVIRRLMQSAVLLLLMSLLVFLGVFAIGNPVDILVSPQADPAEIARATVALGLDKPLWQQYLIFLGHALRGDLGRSFVYGEPAIRVILERLPATLELAVSAMAIAIIPGLPLGLWAGLRPRSIAGRAIAAGSILGFSLPGFWVGLMLIVVFAVELGWLPSTGRGQTVSLFGLDTSFLTRDGLAHLALPAVNLALAPLALVIRLTAAGTREVAPMEYIQFARAKGLRRRRVIGVHMLRNILIPLVTVAGIEFAGIIAFAVVTETIFAWPGIGRLIITSIGALDRPVIVAFLMLTVLLFVLINLVVDILYSLIDPRLRLRDAAA
jgi:peptide/nickel transport system permease protein